MKSFYDYYQEIAMPAMPIQANTPPGGNVAAPIPPVDPATQQIKNLLTQQAGTISRIQDAQLKAQFQHLMKMINSPPGQIAPMPQPGQAPQMPQQIQMPVQPPNPTAPPQQW